MKIGNDLKINIMKKDVDFCIGKKIKMTIENQEFEIILPIVAVEVKTYLDATMFGEVQYSSKLIKNATPNAKTYVLMETNQVGSDKIISARYDNVLNEMFVLRLDEQSLIEYSVLEDYYNEIVSDIADIAVERDVITPGRLINVEEYFLLLHLLIMVEQHFQFVGIVINFSPKTLLFFYREKYTYLEKTVILLLL